MYHVFMVVYVEEADETTLARLGLGANDVDEPVLGRPLGPDPAYAHCHTLSHTHSHIATHIATHTAAHAHMRTCARAHMYMCA